jgi:hypothetical protein
VWGFWWPMTGELQPPMHRFRSRGGEVDGGELEGWQFLKRRGGSGAARCAGGKHRRTAAGCGASVEDINTSATIIPSVEILGPITRS